MSDEIQNAGQRALSDRAKGPVSSSPSPAKTSLASMTASDITNEAAIHSDMDPLAGRFVQEGSPAAQRILEHNATRIKQMRGEVVEELEFQKGDKVYNKRKKQEYKVIRILDAKHVTLQSPRSGRQFDEKIKYLVKL